MRSMRKFLEGQFLVAKLAGTRAVIAAPLAVATALAVAITSASILITGCATGKYNDRDLQRPEYHEGVGIPVTDSVSVGSGKSASLPEALIESGITLAAYPDYYRPSAISGTCVLGERPIEQVPCRNARIYLLDSNRAVLGSTTTDEQGRFAFFVRKEKIYFLSGVVRPTEKGSSESQIDERPLSMGANIVLRLKQR